MASAKLEWRGASTVLLLSLTATALPACSAGATQFADDERNDPVPSFSPSPVGFGVPAGSAAPDDGSKIPSAPSGEGPPDIGNVPAGSEPAAGNGPAEPAEPADPTEPAEPADPADPAEPADPAAATGSTSSASCSLEVSVTTVSPGGRYAPRNVGAIWVADAAGQFIKSLDVWGNRRLSHVEVWNSATTAAGAPGNVVDAVTGATAVAHGNHLASWDCRDFNGQGVPDGDYRVYFEVTESNGAGPNTFANFTKGPAGASVQTGAASFSDIALTFTP